MPLHPRMTVIIGGNGSGKTTIVESLASLTLTAMTEAPEFRSQDHGGRWRC
ncbi:MAG: AAA family ATPase [Bryobacterales bacterium]|nr:AAA family ATPase [Bryobacterales bacterium]